MVEVSVDEPVLRPALEREVIHEYGEPLDTRVKVYSLEEIVAEKLRAILQHVEKLEERGWSRSRARDYYDLWRVLKRYRDEVELAGFASLLPPAQPALSPHPILP
jgi:predicted nucleotidyltransferase component of viral defense system